MITYIYYNLILPLYSRSKHLELDENGTAVATDNWCADRTVSDSLLWSTYYAHILYRSRRGQEEDDSDEDDDEDEEESEEEESEEDAPAPATNQPELSRTERKQLKKQGKTNNQQQAADEDEDKDQDPLFANPNIAAGKKMNISDLSAPRELTRRERYAYYLRFLNPWNSIEDFQGGEREEGCEGEILEGMSSFSVAIAEAFM